MKSSDKFCLWSRFRSFPGLLLILATLFVLFVSSFTKIFANDIWKALYSGRYLSLFHNFPHHSTFTFSPVAEFVGRNSFNWFGNLFFIGLYQIGGFVGLQVFRFLLFLVVVGLLLSLINYRWNALIAFSLIAFIFSIKQKFIMRTAIFIPVFMILLFWIWKNITTNRDVRWFWAYPVLFLIWGNIHGSYIAGVGFFSLMVIGIFLDYLFGIETWSPRVLFHGGTVFVVVLLVVTFPKPYPDYQFWNYTKKLYTKGTSIVSGKSKVPSASRAEKTAPVRGRQLAGDRKRSPANVSSGNEKKTNGRHWSLVVYDNLKDFLNNLIFEQDRWRSGEFSSPLNQPSFLFVGMSMMIIPVGLGTFLLKPSKIRFVHLLPFLGSLVLGFGYIRTVAYFPLVAIPLLYLKVGLGDFSDLELGSISNYAAFAGVLLLVLSMGFWLQRGRLNLFFGTGKEQFGTGLHPRFSTAVPNLIVSNYRNDRFLNHYNLGGYLIWKWWPYKKIFVDSKGSAYKLSFLNTVGRTTERKLVDRFNLDYAVLPVFYPENFAFFIRSPKWKIVAFDRAMMAFKRVENPTYVDPYSVMLMTSRDLEEMPRFRRNVFRDLVDFIYDFQNRGFAKPDKHQDSKETS